MYLLWSEVLTDFTAQDSYTFDLHYTLLFKAVRMSFKNIYNFPHENLTIHSYVLRENIVKAKFIRLFFNIAMLYNHIIQFSM